MKILSVEGVRVSAVYSCVPANDVENAEALKPIYGEKAESIVKATGIFRRRVVDAGVTSLDLCVAAARRLLRETGLGVDAFGAIICVTFTPARQMPGNAVQAQGLLGFGREVLAFDVNMACSGYGYGLYMAGLLARQTGLKVLLLDGDVQTAVLRSDDAATVPVLADAGTATVVEPVPAGASNAWRFAFLSDGRKGECLTLPRDGTITMNGFEVFRFVSTEVARFIRDFLDAVGLKPEEIGTFVPHQANVYMVRQLAKFLKIDPDRVWISGDRLGNSASATVPTTLALVGQNRAPEGPVLLSGFGGGLSASAALLRVDADCRFACFDFSPTGGTSAERI